MALALPIPARPGSSRAHLRAHRRWQAGQALAQREQWPLAAREFEQASGLHGDRGLCAGGGARADQGRPRRPRRPSGRAPCARPIRALALAYTLESHALLGLGRAATAVDMPARDAGRGRRATTIISSRWRSRCSAASRHEEAIRAFFDALALKMDDALSHFRLGMSFKDLGMKAEAAECVRTALAARPRQQRRSRRAASSSSSSARPAAGPGPTMRWRGLRTGARAPLPADTPVETGAVRARGAGRRPARAAQGRAPLCAPCRPALPAAAAHRPPGRTAAGCASAISRPTSISTPPAS